MQIHHDKHHAAYVNNLNTVLADHPDLHAESIEELVSDLDAVPEEIRTTVRNNGGHFNHSMSWEIMTPDSTAPSGDLAAAIDRDHRIKAFDDVRRLSNGPDLASLPRSSE